MQTEQLVVWFTYELKVRLYGLTYLSHQMMLADHSWAVLLFLLFLFYSCFIPAGTSVLIRFDSMLTIYVEIMLKMYLNLNLNKR